LARSTVPNVAQLLPEHVAVQEHKRVERLVLGDGSDITLDGEVFEERAGVLVARHVQAGSGEDQIAACPVCVRGFGAQRIVPDTHLGAQPLGDVRQAGTARGVWAARVRCFAAGPRQRGRAASTWGRCMEEAEKQPQRIYGCIDLRGRGVRVLREGVPELPEVCGGAGLGKRPARRGFGKAAGPENDLGLRCCGATPCC
jgi:hypothetical protein